jgi:hypothetical protein
VKAMSRYCKVSPSLYMSMAKIFYRHHSVCRRTNKVVVMKGCFRPLHSPSTFPLAREANATRPCSCCLFPSNQHHQWITYYYHHTAGCGCFGSTGKYHEDIQDSQGDLRLDDRVLLAQPGSGNRWRMTGLGVQPRCWRRNVLSLSMTCNMCYQASVDLTKEYPSCPSGSLCKV